MIESLDLTDVQGFKNHKPVELGKVNVFIGENLCGKKQLVSHLYQHQDVEVDFIEQLSDEHFEFICDKFEDWFFPIFKDLKQVGSCYYHYYYQSEYDDKWYSDKSINSVIQCLHTVLNVDVKSSCLFPNFAEGLNPHLAAHLFNEMIQLANKNDKQLIIFTNQPEVLNVLEMKNDDHRLFVFDFKLNSSTRITRVSAPKPLKGQAPVRMSEAWLRGYIGGLPRGVYGRFNNGN